MLTTEIPLYPNNLDARNWPNPTNLGTVKIVFRFCNPTQDPTQEIPLQDPKRQEAFGTFASSAPFPLSLFHPKM
jgi:hypothetical protein